MYPVNKPEVFVTFAAEKIDHKGRIRDEKTREKNKRIDGESDLTFKET